MQVKTVSSKLLEERRQELRRLDAEIAERTRYRKNQEAIITDIVESGNTKLMGLNHEIMVAEHQLRELKTDIRTCAHDKVILMSEIESIHIQIMTPPATLVAPSFS